MSQTLVFKLLTKSQWDGFAAEGSFMGAPVDLADGFIHLSTSAQVVETARRHFADCQDLILAAIEIAALDSPLRWEPSRGGDLFPHLYAPLALAAVKWTKALPLRADGTHEFPELLG